MSTEKFLIVHSQISTFCRYLGLNPAKKTVSKEEHKSWMKATFTEDEGYLSVQTPKEEAEMIEELLGMSPGELGDSMVKLVKGCENCKDCGRLYTFLDIIYTGLGVHDKQFLNDVLSGRHGCTMNYTSPQVHRCYECNMASPTGSICYATLFYGCGR